MGPSSRPSHHHNATSSEHTPLLPPPQGPAAAAQRHRRPGLRQRATSIASTILDAAPKARRPQPVMAILCTLIFVASLSGGFYSISMTRIFEDILCRQYYGQIHGDAWEKPIDEEMCKVDAIQSDLAYLFATMASLNAGVSLLLALPWGIAADKIGRRPVFALSVFGMSLTLLWIMIVGWFGQTLSPRLIWLSAIGCLVGGGKPVVFATVTSIVIDIVPESQRSASFIRIHGSNMVGDLLSPAVASFMMARTGPWPPITIAFFLLALSPFAIFLVPEGQKHEQQPSSDSDSEETPNGSSFKSHVKQSLDELKKLKGTFSAPSMVLILLIMMLQLPLVLCTGLFLSQFVSRRYGIPIAETGYVQSVYGAAFLVVSFVIVPAVSSVVLWPRAPAFLRFDDDRPRDLVFARASYVASMTGTFVLGLAASLPDFICGLVILAFGVASDGFIKSVATLYAAPEQRTRLFTVLGLSSVASDLWASPALAVLFSAGMRLGGVWMGLPYFGLSGLCVLMFSMSLFVRLPLDCKAVDASEEGNTSCSE